MLLDNENFAVIEERLTHFDDVCWYFGIFQGDSRDHIEHDTNQSRVPFVHVDAALGVAEYVLDNQREFLKEFIQEIK